MAWSTPQNKNLAASLSRAVASSSVPPGEHTPSDGLEQQEDGVCPDGEERDDMDIYLEPSPDRSEYHDPANAPEDRLNEQMTLKLICLFGQVETTANDGSNDRRRWQKSNNARESSSWMETVQRQIGENKTKHDIEEHCPIETENVPAYCWSFLRPVHN
jgi:hypothetical protein